MTPTTTSTTTESSYPTVSSPTVTASTLPVAPLSSDKMIVFEDVSKFYGEILGVNQVNLQMRRALRVSSDRTVRANDFDEFDDGTD
jgi:hypothetical protein